MNESNENDAGQAGLPEKQPATSAPIPTPAEAAPTHIPDADGAPPADAKSPASTDGTTPQHRDDAPPIEEAVANAALPQPAAAPPKATPKKKRLFVKILFGFGIAVAAVVLIAVCLRLFVFHDTYIKNQVTAAVDRELGVRCTIDNLDLSLFSATIELQGIKVDNLETEEEFSQVLQVTSVRASCSPWATITSGSLAGVEVDIQSPDVHVVRLRDETGKEVTNVDSVVVRLLQLPWEEWIRTFNLPDLRGVVRFQGGVVAFDDAARSLGKSEVKDIQFALYHQGLGKPSRLEGGSLKLVTPQTPKGGTLTFAADALWLAKDGKVHLDGIRDANLTLNLDHLDLPYLARYVGVGGPIAGGEFHWSLGRPLSGEVTVRAKDLSEIETDGRIQTAGALSIWQQDTWRAGNIAASLRWHGGGGLKADGLQLDPTKIDIALAKTLTDLNASQARRAFDVIIGIKQTQDKALEFSVKSTSQLERLFSTDVGALLHMQNQLGGSLLLDLNTVREPSGALRATAKLTSEDTYIMVDKVKQPTETALSAAVALTPDAKGWPQEGQVNVTCKSGFLSLTSKEPIKLTGLNSQATVDATGNLVFQVDTARLWKEYAPLLSLLGLNHPLEELIEGQLTFMGTPGRIQVYPGGKILHGADDAAPFLFSGFMEYNGEAMAMNPKNRFLDLRFQLARKGEAPLNVLLNCGVSKSSGNRLRWVLKNRGSGSLEAVQDLVARLGQYAAPLQQLDLTYKGRFTQGVSATLMQTFDADGLPSRLKADLTALSLTIVDLDLSAPADQNGAPPVHIREPSMQVLAKGEMEWTPTQTQMQLEQFDVTSKLLHLRARVGRFSPDALLRVLADNSAFNDALLSSLPKANVAMQLDTLTTGAGALPPAMLSAVPEAYVPLFEKGLVARLRANYDPDTRRLDLPELRLHTGTLFCDLNTKGVPLDLLARAVANGDIKPFLGALSDVALQGWATPKVFRVLMQEKILPPGLVLLGTGSIKASYLAQAKSLTIDELTFRESTGSNSLVQALALQGDIADPLGLLDLKAPIELPRHLGKQGLVLKTLYVSPTALDRYLAQFGASLRENGVELGQAVVRDLAVLPGERAGVFQVHGTVFSKLRIPDPEAPESALLNLDGAVMIAKGAPMYLALLPDRIATSGTLVLDYANIEFSGAYPYVYKKPAKTVARLSVQMDAGSTRNIRLKTLVLRGGPQGVEARDFVLDATPAHLAMSLRSLLLSEPVNAQLGNVLLDTQANRLAFVAKAPQIDLAKLQPYLASAKPFALSGGISGVDVSYDGPFTIFKQLTTGEGGGGQTKSKIAATASTIQMRATESNVNHFFGMRLASVDGSLQAGLVEINNLVIESPEGFRRTDPVKIKKVRMVVDLPSLSTDQVVITELTLDGVDATVEVGLGSNNLSAIQESIAYFQSCMDTGTGQSKKMLIKDLYMKNSVVRASPKPLMGLSIIPPTPIPDLHLQNVSGDSGSAVFTQVFGNVFGAVFNVAGTVVKGLGKGAGKVIKGAGGVVKDVGTGIGSGVKRLFGGDKDEAPRDGTDP